MATDAEIWVSGLGFPEGLRWHGGSVWFSDFHERTVNRVAADGTVQRQAYVAGQPSGLGFRPDGTPLVVSMLDRNLLAIGAERLSLVAPLIGIAGGPLNDMFVDSRGRAYISGFGYEAMLEGLDTSRTTPLFLVDENGAVAPVGEPLHMPNGVVALPDGRTLVVSETTSLQLTAFDIADDGTLSNKRLFADLDGRAPDGLAVDREGAVWVACYAAGEVLRVRDGGEVLDRVAFPNVWVTACALGGADGRTLYVSLADTDHTRAQAGESKGSIARVTVAVPAP